MWQNGCYEIWVNDTTNTVNEIVKWLAWGEEHNLIMPKSDITIVEPKTGTDKTTKDPDINRIE